MAWNSSNSRSQSPSKIHIYAFRKWLDTPNHHLRIWLDVKSAYFMTGITLEMELLPLNHGLENTWVNLFHSPIFVWSYFTLPPITGFLGPP